MRKIIFSITALVFLIWILPLGIFIKPSQEKVACNGQRAICLCTHRLGKPVAKSAAYKGIGAAQKKHNEAGGAGLDFLAARQKDRIAHQGSFHRQ